LWWLVLSCADNFKRWTLLFQLLQKHKNQSGIIYTLTRKSTEEITSIINRLIPEVKIAFYHGGMTAKDRQSIQQQFIDNQIDVIVATNAFGMGVDKPNIRFVIHFHRPNSIEAYVQEVGRAGRDREQAWCYLLNQQQDQKINLDLIGNDKKKLEKYKWLQSLLTSKSCIKKNTATYFSSKYRTTCTRCSKCSSPQISSKLVKESYQKLLLLRKSLAKKHKLKPSYLLTQKQAALITLFKPKTRQQLLKIPGFGQGWVETIWPLLENDRIYQELTSNTKVIHDNK
jgi:superfamily II DNA helicase RecQ